MQNHQLRAVAGFPFGGARISTVPCRGRRTLSADTFAERHFARSSGSCAGKGRLDPARTLRVGLFVFRLQPPLGNWGPVIARDVAEQSSAGPGSSLFAQRVAPSRTPGRIAHVPGRPGNLLPESHP